MASLTFAESATGPGPDGADDRRIAGAGTSESQWQAWPGLSTFVTCSVDEIVPSAGRVVVVAPHPDDEVLMCGGLLAMLAVQAGAARPAPEVVLVAVTEGEASHPGSLRWTPSELAARRRAEREAGLHRLGIASRVRSLSFADGGVTAREASLVSRLESILRPEDRVITTWRLDGHPDHEATGRACAAACRSTRATLVEVPVWTWHWAHPGDARVPWHRLRRLPLTPMARHRKAEALDAHATQLQPDGDRGPVLFPDAIARLMRPFEFFLQPACAR